MLDFQYVVFINTEGLIGFDGGLSAAEKRAVNA
jgi:hypothetical protein